jgi:hypothetical protein
MRRETLGGTSPVSSNQKKVHLVVQNGSKSPLLTPWVGMVPNGSHQFSHQFCHPFPALFPQFSPRLGDFCKKDHVGHFIIASRGTGRQQFTW